MHSTWSWELRRVIQDCRNPMKPAQIIRIVLLLAAIFAAGIVTGRLTSPRPPTLVVTADGRVTTSESLLVRLNRELRLTAEQERQFRTLLEELAREVSPLPPASHERLAKFNGYAPRMKALLRPDQHANFERYVRDTQKRYERWMHAHPQTNRARP